MIRETLAIAPEMAGCCPNSSAEMPGPEPGHHHAPRQRMIGLGEPQRERASPLRHESGSGQIVQVLVSSQNFRITWIHLWTRSVEITAGCHVDCWNQTVVPEPRSPFQTIHVL